MGILKNSEYIAQARSRIADNAARQINEADVRLTFEDTANSYINRADGLDIPAYDSSALYGVGDNVVYNRSIYQKINGSSLGELPTNAAEWENKGSEVFAQQGRYGLARPATEALVTGGTDNSDYITPLRLAEAFEANGLGGFPDRSVLFSNGGLASGTTDFNFSGGRLGLQVFGPNPNANLHVGNSSGNDIIALFSNNAGLNAYTFFNNGHIAIRNRSTPFTDALVDRYKQYGKDYQGNAGQSSPYFLTEDGLEIGLREIKDAVDAIPAGVRTLSGSLTSATTLSGTTQVIGVFESFDNNDNVASNVAATGATLVEGAYIAHYKITTATDNNEFSVSLALNGAILPYATSFGKRDATGFTLIFESDGSDTLSMTATDLSGTDPIISSAICSIQKIR